MQNFWDKFKSFMAQPFSGDQMSALDWFWFMGLIIVISIAWRLILTHIEEDI